MASCGSLDVQTHKTTLDSMIHGSNAMVSNGKSKERKKVVCGRMRLLITFVAQIRRFKWNQGEQMWNYDVDGDNNTTSWTFFFHNHINNVKMFIRNNGQPQQKTTKMGIIRSHGIWFSPENYQRKWKFHIYFYSVEIIEEIMMHNV